MERIIVGSSLFLLASFAAFAQTEAPLSFEVASVKPAAPNADGQIMRRVGGGPGSPDPGAFTFNNVTLKMLVTRAYNLKDYQVEGPEWIDSIGYDIIAKMPEGTTREQSQKMLQTLLAERFKVTIHRETKQLPVFALVVGKGGSKMKEVEVPAPGAGGAASGRSSSGPGVRMMMTPAGRHLIGQMTMTQLSNALTNQMDRAVLDQTELPATYDVDITWMPDEMDRNSGRIAQLAAISGAGPGGGPGRGGDNPHAADDPVMTLPQALQEKLGLKLEPRKSMAEVLIIDRAERAPVEN